MSSNSSHLLELPSFRWKDEAGGARRDHGLNPKPAHRDPHPRGGHARTPELGEPGSLPWQPAHRPLPLALAPPTEPREEEEEEAEEAEGVPEAEGPEAAMLGPEGGMEEEAAAPPGPARRLDTVLRGLYDLGETPERPQAKPKKRKESAGQREVALGLDGPGAGPDGPGAGPAAAKPGHRPKRTRHFFEELRGELQSVQGPGPGPAAPGAPEAPEGGSRPVPVVEFCSRRKQRQPPQPEAGGRPQAPAPQAKASVLKKQGEEPVFDLEKARLEVHRFGITGYGKGKERALERERAIMLGAKPPKREYVNYKVLQEMVKLKKAAKNEGSGAFGDPVQGPATLQQMERKPKKKYAPRVPFGSQTGQVGKFQNGMLLLSSQDIKKINSSRVVR
ncbi:uncharacterized protein C1orf131 homolog [Tachyglossus aculeatus]|uniref:uncharacterized protein C1orf131 homolog n=1 Tax=Tachyglossus aculeatus TaxID=9261 RepID=UPI0018F4B28B|nr:uncharacterized protein C1orf131 homolog [Tachyglossus aculeatus]